MSNNAARAASRSDEHHLLLVQDPIAFAPFGAKHPSPAEDGFNGRKTARGVVIGALAGLITWIALAAGARVLWGWLGG